MNKNDLIRDWVEKSDPSNSLDDDDSQSAISSSECASSVVAESDISDLTGNFENVHLPSNYMKDVPANIFYVNDLKNTQNITPIDATLQNCSNVHIGDKYYIKGVLIMKPDDKTVVKQHLTSRPQITHKGEEKEESLGSDVFVNDRPTAIIPTVLRYVDRNCWLAQPPMEDPDILERPVPYVIISHTATATSHVQAEMILHVRRIQQFHIESMKFADIAYNFLIGGDGMVYEGRGWEAMGAHTKGYNIKSIGISFVGTYMNRLPAQICLEACKVLIQEGIKLGHIKEDYKLLCHCQCSSTESPGKMLFEEIQNWPHWSRDP